MKQLLENWKRYVIACSAILYFFCTFYWVLWKFVYYLNSQFAPLRWISITERMRALHGVFLDFNFWIYRLLPLANVLASNYINENLFIHSYIKPEETFTTKLSCLFVKFVCWYTEFLMDAYQPANLQKKQCGGVFLAYWMPIEQKLPPPVLFSAILPAGLLLMDIILEGTFGYISLMGDTEMSCPALLSGCFQTPPWFANYFPFHWYIALVLLLHDQFFISYNIRSCSACKHIHLLFICRVIF